MTGLPYGPTPEQFAAQQRMAMEQSARQTARSGERQVEHLQSIELLATQLHQATLDVHQSVQDMATETGRAQRLALMVGVATALIGALVGGVAGAVAARVIGTG